LWGGILVAMPTAIPCTQHTGCTYSLTLHEAHCKLWLAVYGAELVPCCEVAMLMAGRQVTHAGCKCTADACSRAGHARTQQVSSCGTMPFIQQHNRCICSCSSRLGRAGPNVHVCMHTWVPLTSKCGTFAGRTRGSSCSTKQHATAPHCSRQGGSEASNQQQQCTCIINVANS
jgi:hypothetical protein